MDHARGLRRAQGARRLRPGDQHVGNAAAAAWRGARQRHGLHRQQAAHGERKDARRRRSRSRHRLARRPRASAERRHAVTPMFTSTIRALGSTLAIAVVCAAGVALVHAQNPMLLRWDKAAPFPEPEEELYGVEAGGKMYVIGGFSENGKAAPAMVYEWDPAADKWTKKKPIPVPVHHQAQTQYNGKIYIFGGCQRPLSGPGMSGWQPVDNSWEYDPRTDTWRALAPMPVRRCAAVAEQVGGKIYVIGGATVMENSGEAALFGDRPARILGTNQMYDPATNTWTNRSPMSTARNHAFSGVVNGKIYVIGGRLGAAHVTASSNTDVVEEYDPARDRWIVLPSMPTARHGAAGAFIGNRFHLVSGKPEGGGLPDLAGKGLPVHDVLEIPANFGTN